ncbi:hypothetical protein HNP46_004667 [Pseudomonas nitritireducens]|uniref:Uncharacterized protein n=1 Tax=Pseudomonas nitroreducens TaxID=46680 RepID=A0A7W7KN00_PSENT|nr:hypothetical protein [Pseudomonas nitritireducens]MBB4865766.1 hypothetical protein [Pseudomonas nitritireducens]
MQRTVHFLISPNACFAERVRKTGSSELIHLAEPTLWSGQEGDVAPMQTAAMDAVVKLLFVEMTKRERQHIDEFQEEFGEIPVSIAFFDLNWTVTRIDLDMTVRDAVEDALLSGSFKAMIPSGNAMVDELLAHFEWNASSRLKG